MRLIVLSGAGISAESGLRTFRDHDGLWENYPIEQVATPEAWARDPDLVQRFYNERRKAVLAAEPNDAHRGLARLEDRYNVEIVTQNIDNLHERAGSTHVLHLHGEITKARSSIDPRLIYDVDGWQIPMGSLCEKGSQLQPHIVWFGESVPMIDAAIDVVRKADIFVVIGTSLAVYPAASLVDYVPRNARRFLIDPSIPSHAQLSGFQCISKGAVAGVAELAEILAR